MHRRLGERNVLKGTTSEQCEISQVASIGIKDKFSVKLRGLAERFSWFTRLVVKLVGGLMELY